MRNPAALLAPKRSRADRSQLPSSPTRSSIDRDASLVDAARAYGELDRVEADRRRFRSDLCARKRRENRGELRRHGIDAPTRIRAGAERRIADAMALVDSHSHVDSGRARRLRMLTTALTDDPIHAADTAVWGAALARLEAPDVQRHPESLTARAALALSDLSDDAVPFRASLTGELRQARVRDLTRTTDHHNNPLPADLHQLVLDYAVGTQGLVRQAAGRHATPFVERERRADEIVGYAAVGALGGAGLGGVVGFASGIALGGIGAFILPPLGAVAGSSAAGALSAAANIVVNAPSDAARAIRKRTARKRLDREHAGTGRQPA